jgi:hypothetical protein
LMGWVGAIRNKTGQSVLQTALFIQP